MDLTDIFDSVVLKRLAKVDLPDAGSHQHEINGVQAIKEFFATDQKVQGNISWHYFGDDQDVLPEINTYTFYDARAKHSSRTEWRLYYGGSFLRHADEGDILVLARRDKQVYGIVIQQDSSWTRAIKYLLGFYQVSDTYFHVTDEQLGQTQVDFVTKRIVEELELEIEIPTTLSDEQIVIAAFDGRFPTTREMSELAINNTDFNLQHPDETLVALLDREEQLFRALEKVIVGEKLSKGFESVDEFITYSLSVQNRRKSRMGHALENHLEYIFNEHNVQFDRGGRTEAKKKPDFLFPGSDAYLDPTYPTDSLYMLGAKSTCKDRWRQVLSEADRIKNKHLCTLETSISVNQTDEMQQSNLTLIVPRPIQETYAQEQLDTIWSLEEFIDRIKFAQSS
ncbi:MAG: restriction endonuclease [Chloroflexi bacterium]|nr:restriction endonuclease [Chloroflexota bacterium]